VRTNGQTVGKRLLGIRVITRDGNRMDWRSAVLREVILKTLLFQVITILPTVGVVAGSGIFLADYFWPLPDSERRALHDIVASTRVIAWPRLAERAAVEGPTFST